MVRSWESLRILAFFFVSTENWYWLSDRGLLPALRSVNQSQKSDRLPSAERLTKAREIIVDWWTAGYANNANALIGERFRTEATASLPGIIKPLLPETIFDGMEFQRLRLHHDQQVPEWE